MTDNINLRSFDLETFKICPGRVAPPIVVGSVAQCDSNGHVHGEILYPRQVVLNAAASYVNSRELVLVGAHIAFDMTCIAQAYPQLIPAIFQLYKEGRVYDVGIAQTLDAIFGGHLGLDPRSGGPLRNPSTKEVTTRYALATVLDLVLGRTDAKDAAAWRTSYALLNGVPLEAWPSDAKEYPVHDTRNALYAALVQRNGWHRGRMEPDERGPARNIKNLAAQCEVAFCLALGACWSLRTDGVAVEALALKVEGQHAVAVKRFQQWGWRRADGTEDQAAVRKAVAIAYGATGTCKRCGGGGKIEPIKTRPCRGEKVRGRYQECGASGCKVCKGSGLIEYLGEPATCKASDGGCDGTGLDLETAPLMPRSDLGGIRADRDTLMESGDDELAVYGEDEFEKTRTTFVKYLRTGVFGPLKIVPNVLVATGRISYEGSPFHQIPRSGGVRECIVARDGMVLGSTDYEAGELCSLAQFCFWLFKHSSMLDAINASGSPGILHSELAASIVGISIGEFLLRLKAKDKQCKDYRQAVKPISFGKPAAMGSAKIVWTSRKKNAGFTPSEYGPSVDDDGNQGFCGVRFCILIGGNKRCGANKITSWKGHSTYPVCKVCVDIVEHVLSVAYFKRFPEIRQYHKWVGNRIGRSDDDSDNENMLNAGRMPCLAWNGEKGVVEVLRMRGGVDFSAACNNGFQALLADIMKLAYVNMTREGYLGIRPDGSPSPLAGCRFPVVMHDEPVSELFAETAHLSGPRIGEIMVDAGKALAPDVCWVAQTGISRMLSKSIEPVFDANGKLIPWEPKKKAA